MWFEIQTSLEDGSIKVVVSRSDGQPLDEREAEALDRILRDVLDRGSTARGCSMAMLHDILSRRVDEFQMSARPRNKLRGFGIVYIGDLVQRTEQDFIGQNFGRKSMNEITDVVWFAGGDRGWIRLGMQPHELLGWQRPTE